MGVDKASFTRQDQKDGGAEDDWSRSKKKIIKGEQNSKSCCRLGFLMSSGSKVVLPPGVEFGLMCSNVPLFDMVSITVRSINTVSGYHTSRVSRKTPG